MFDNNSQNSDRVIMSVGIECKIFILRPNYQSGKYFCVFINQRDEIILVPKWTKKNSFEDLLIV